MVVRILLEESDPMLNKFKLSLLALATAVLLPATASAFTFYPRSLDPGDTFLTSSDPTDGINDAILGREFHPDNTMTASNSYSFNIFNDQSVGQTVAFVLTGISGLTNFRFTLDGFFIDETSAARATLAPNSGSVLTVMFDQPPGTTGGRFITTIAAVPVPASLVLMLTALGGLVFIRRRKSEFAAA